MAGMRVVITGATGNVGTSLIELLAEEPEVDTVLGIARRTPAWRPAKTTWAAVDVGRDDLVPHFDGAAVVVHLAWIFQPLDAFERDHGDVRVVRLRPGFIFKHESASEQRRLFAGPLLPNTMVRPGLIPILPDLSGLRFQALHSLYSASAGCCMASPPRPGQPHALRPGSGPARDGHR